MVSISVDHRDFHTVHKANGIHTNFAIVETVISPFNRWPLENLYCILKSNVVPPKILKILFVRPSVAHGIYLHNVNIIGKGGSLAAGNSPLISDACNLLFLQG